MEFKRFLKSSGKADVALRAALAARQNSHPYKPSEAANSAPNLPRQPLAVAVGIGNQDQDRNSLKESQPQRQEPQSGISLPGGICKPDGTPVKTKYRLRRMVKGRIEVFEFDVMMPAGNQRYDELIVTDVNRELNLKPVRVFGSNIGPVDKVPYGLIQFEGHDYVDLVDLRQAVPRFSEVRDILMKRGVEISKKVNNTKNKSSRKQRLTQLRAPTPVVVNAFNNSNSDSSATSTTQGTTSDAKNVKSKPSKTLPASTVSIEKPSKALAKASSVPLAVGTENKYRVNAVKSNPSASAMGATGQETGARRKTSQNSEPTFGGVSNFITYNPVFDKLMKQKPPHPKPNKNRKKKTVRFLLGTK